MPILGRLAEWITGYPEVMWVRVLCAAGVPHLLAFYEPFSTYRRTPDALSPMIVDKSTSQI
jgi:hypothetical protein